MEDQSPVREEKAPASTATRWLVVLVVILFCATAIALGYGAHQQQAVRQMSADEQSMNSSIIQLRDQIDALTAKVNAPPSPAQTSEQPAAPEQSVAEKRVAARRRAADERRLKQIQSELEDHQKQLQATQQAVESARSDLQGELGSTKDELNGSIARTHEELVALEKRGQRNFVEFDLDKSKTFQRVGPISVELRKADVKHESYDLMLLVDDYKLSKKKVNLYEPVWIHETDYPQPLQLVVNRIQKNHVHGYVSAPKYREAELAASGSSAASTNPLPDQPLLPFPDDLIAPHHQPPLNAPLPPQ